MTNDRPPSALIADDEPLLAQALATELARAWPGLRIVGPVGNGPAALQALQEQRPDIAFLDIRMPGASGLDVARALAEDWDDADRAPPLVVFVTAFGDHALEAFEHAAVDYLLKPVTAQRLAQCIRRLRERLTARQPDEGIDVLARQVRALLDREDPAPVPAGAAPGPVRHDALRTIQASVGDRIQMIPTDTVRLFEAADKYVIVHHAGGEALIREPLRELLPRLDPARFRQIHRGSIVNLDFVEAAEREDNGRMRLVLRGHATRPLVSRLYTHLFRPM